MKVIGYTEKGYMLDATKEENIEHSKVQKDLKNQISEGCVVLPDCVEFIGIEEPIVVLE